MSPGDNAASRRHADASAGGTGDPAEAGMLCQFIARATQLNPHSKPGPQLAALAGEIFGVELAAIFDADLREVYWAGEPLENLEDVMQNICLFETASHDHTTGLIRRVLRLGRLSVGSVLLRGEISPPVVDAIAAVIAITFDRYHAFASESRTESARQTEQMRTMVLDSLAHAYKTPLTAIEAASSGLAAIGNLSPAQTELVSLIEEQTSLLSRLTTRLLKTARLEASDLVPHASEVAIEPMIEDVLGSLRDALSGFRVKRVLSRDDLSLFCDRNMIIALLTQFLDNATKYAEPGSDITVQVVEKLNAVVFSVRSFGAVIPEADRERIFDRYFRSSIHTSTVPSTGIGLSIVKRVAQAHGGHTWVTSDARMGTIFYASLPVAMQGGAAA